MASEIDSDKFAAPATRGDVAGVAIDVALALREIASALQTVADGGDVSKHIVKIHSRAAEVRKQFDRLIVEEKK